ncbi:MAG: tetratricopeptide repeat protein [Verrucomicrobia bacterium]|nr:MAG: tetratricopeptide repeat protein [Verrucomicrobiota bacterium]
MTRQGARRWMAAVVAAAACGAPVWASPETAREQLERRQYPAARSEYERLLSGRPDDARLAYNAGVAAFRQQDLDGAARHFESVLGAGDLRLQERAYFNLGNTRFRQGEAAADLPEKQRLWQDAEKHFEAALGLNSSDVDAKANLDAVRQHLAALPRPQQPPDGQSKDKDKQKQGEKDKKPGDPNDPSQKDGEKGDSQEKNESGKSGKPKDDASKEKGQPKDGDSQQGESNKDQPGMEQNQKKPQSDKGDGSKKGEGKGGEEKGARDGKDGGEPRGKEGSPQRAESGANGEGQGAGVEPETPEGQMAVRFAERLLDGHKSQERALIWRPAGNGRETGAIQGRRKTW